MDPALTLMAVAAAMLAAIYVGYLVRSRGGCGREQEQVRRQLERILSISLVPPNDFSLVLPTLSQSRMITFSAKNARFVSLFTAH